ncbi:MAG: serine/threonine protein kinase [Polyangiaceae bacterium]|nr:serine/threonine protein kinase [Polyangiaceae bacterium]
MGFTGDVSAGATLGRYELLVPIALGGMASVWAARTAGAIDKIVAMKVIRAELSDDGDFEQMFLDEAELVSQLHHPNVVEILDLGEENDTLYQVMEWVDGEPLHLVLRESKASGGVPLPITLRIVKQVCAGLHVAHELKGPTGELIGLVHRDVSPQNLLVGYDGIVKVVDFGVAKAASNLQRTRVGEVKGKVPYMSPEQGRGEQVDRRSDIFALGIVFYQLVTGKHPFMADSEPATLRRIGDPSPADPARSLVPSLPAEIEQVIMRALAKDRDQRFATMAEMLRALERATPASMQIGAAEVAGFMQRVLGPRGERRRAAIKEAMQAARGGHPFERPPDSRTPRAFARDSHALVAAPASIAIAAAAAALGDHGPAPLRRRAALSAPWYVRAQAARRAQIAAFVGVFTAVLLAMIAAMLIAGSVPDDRPTLTAARALRGGDMLTRAARSAAARAAPAPEPSAPAPPAAASSAAPTKKPPGR